MANSPENPGGSEDMSRLWYSGGDEATSKYNDELTYEDYMRQFANPFEDDPLAKEIAETNAPKEGETGDQYEARIRREAELSRAAKKDSRDTEKESQEAYNKRVAKEVDDKLEREAKAAKIRDRILNSPNLKTKTKVYARYEEGDNKGKIIIDETEKRNEMKWNFARSLILVAHLWANYSMKKAVDG